MNISVMPPERLVIASRESRLAMWQAKHVQALLKGLYPHCEISILGMTTRGDQILDKSLSKIGGKGLFIKELENALLEGKADLAVHSLKDVPMEMPEGFELTAILEREDPHDAFVSNQYDSLKQMPKGAKLGTSSLRREAQIKKKFPNIDIVPLRGNLDTRLAKLDRGEFDAMILATAGLTRLELTHRIKASIPPEECLPAAGQGALGIEILSQNIELAQFIAPLRDILATYQVSAERQVSRRLGGSCEIPIAAYATWDSYQTTLQLKALVSNIDGSQTITAQASALITHFGQAIDLGNVVADALIRDGAEHLIASLGN
ncbi:MAG: hydroxymethylbilane synthase [Betaproteobacteria bacterium]